MRIQVVWYERIKKTAVVGLSPFDGDYSLTEKTQINPMQTGGGGESHTGILSPSDNSSTHHPNDYFSEGDKTSLVERMLNKKRIERERKKRKKKKQKSLQKELSHNLLSSKRSWYKSAQFGEVGPKFPTFGPEDWIVKTYKEIRDIDDQRAREKAEVPVDIEETIIDVVGDNQGKGVFINDNIVLTSSEAVGQAQDISLSKGGRTYKGSVLTSNPQMGITALVVNDPEFHVEAPAKLGDSDLMKSEQPPSPITGSPSIAKNNAVVGISSGGQTIPINSVKSWMRQNGIDFEEIH